MVNYDSSSAPCYKRGRASHTKICRMLPSICFEKSYAAEVSVRLGSTFSASVAEKASIAVIELSGGFAAGLKISLLAEIVTEVLVIFKNVLNDLRFNNRCGSQFVARLYSGVRKAIRNSTTSDSVC
jgi:hypothetical protein